MFHRKRAFTLIELLVVIAIIALLVAMLLPALKGARKTAMKVKSLGNIAQINVAARMYCDDNQGFWPITLTYDRGGTFIPGRSGALIGWCTWSFGGKNNNGWWRQNNPGFDVEAADRPLNPYLYPEITWDAPPPPQPLPVNDPARVNQLAEIFRDPSDLATRQRNWPNETPAVSSYEDVGTSYHWSYRWFYQSSLPFERRFNWGVRQMRIADNFLSSRYVWVYDQTADVVVSPQYPNLPAIINGYGEPNKSVSGFLDGHAAYIKYIRHQTTGPDYTLLFTYTRQE